MGSRSGISYRIIGILLTLASSVCYGQQASVSGKVTDENNNGLPLVTIRNQTSGGGSVTDSIGNFMLSYLQQDSVVLEFSFVGYLSEKVILRPKQKDFDARLVIKLLPNPETLATVEVQGEQSEVRDQSGLTSLDPKEAEYLPGAFGEISDILATLPGISKINEFSASYSVRGGSFDENLVYVNDIPIYRPFLTRTGQQEGLSFVNPVLVERIKFSAGGWQARWGDKLSSVLDITYRKPDSIQLSATAGLLGGNVHAEGAYKNWSLLIGARYKNAGSLLGTTEINGEYRPRSGDVQSLIKYEPNSRHAFEALSSYNANRYLLFPTDRESTFGSVQDQLKLTIYFDGQENVTNDLTQQVLKYTFKPNQKFTTSFAASYFFTLERERSEVEGAYILSRVIRDDDANNNEPDVDERLEAIGAGTNYIHIRNRLQASVLEAISRSKWQWRQNQSLEFGLRVGTEKINDTLEEYQFVDSADYSTFDPQKSIFNSLSLHQNRFQAYLQNSSHWQSDRHTLTYGARLHYSDYTTELLVSPRLQYAYKPVSATDVVYTLAIGLYNQPPFYREFRRIDGSINPNVKAQQSLQVLAGGDWNFNLWGRLFNFSAEGYYKQLYKLNAYDQENVRIRYFADNNTTGKITGIDGRLSGELIPGAESWVSAGLLVAREDVTTDSRGFIPRPTDQRINLGIFIQDHIPNDPSLRAYLKLLYGSGLPFSIPNQPNTRALYRSPSYTRVDLGLSKIITTTQSNWLDTVWLGLEVLNLLANQNIINYSFIQDVSGNQYAVPNTLSARFLNLKVVVHTKKSRP